MNLGPPKTKPQLFLCGWANLASSSLTRHSKLLRKQWILFEPGITCSSTQWDVKLFKTLYFTFYQIQWNIKPFLTRNLTLKRKRWCVISFTVFFGKKGCKYVSTYFGVPFPLWESDYFDFLIGFRMYFNCSWRQLSCWMFGFKCNTSLAVPHQSSWCKKNVLFCQGT